MQDTGAHHAQINCDPVVDTTPAAAVFILYPSPVYVIYGRLDNIVFHTDIMDTEFIDMTRFIWR